MRLRGVRGLRAGAAVLVPVLGAVLLTALGPAAVPAAADEPGDRVVSEQVSFDVVTRNRSGVPCATDPAQRRVTVRGHITGPADELDDGVSGALYSHGNGYGEFFWRLDAAGGDYNVVRKLADQGHVSVTIDRLGYGASDKPDGDDICFGTEADVLHQIVQRLRAGDYQGERTPRFDRVALLGHSASGIIAEQEAAGFQDIDALGVLSSGELNAGPRIVERMAEFTVRCTGEMLGGDGYAPLEANEAQFRADHLYNIDDGIADQVAARRTDDACGGLRNAPAAIAANPARNGGITVPVLFLVGRNDAFFSGDNRAQAATYRSSEKVTLVELPDTGHGAAFGRTAPAWRAELHRWLEDNRF